MNTSLNAIYTAHAIQSQHFLGVLTCFLVRREVTSHVLQVTKPNWTLDWVGWGSFRSMEILPPQHVQPFLVTNTSPKFTVSFFYLAFLSQNLFAQELYRLKGSCPWDLRVEDRVGWLFSGNGFLVI